jgi:hypothetical protein
MPSLILGIFIDIIGEPWRTDSQEHQIIGTDVADTLLTHGWNEDGVPGCYFLR